jgi:electron transport complex protein RnfG
MAHLFRLFAALTIISLISGGLLAAVKNGTQDRIEYQQLKFVKGPVLKTIFKEASNDPLADRFKIPQDKGEVNCFVGVLGGKRNTIAIEGFGKGFGGNIGVLVAINTDNDKIIGIGVTTHSETPGLGSRAKEDPAFAAQFKGKPITDPFKVKADGGKIDALSGATVSSRGVCGAVLNAAETYQKLKSAIVQKLKEKA